MEYERDGSVPFAVQMCKMSAYPCIDYLRSSVLWYFVRKVVRFIDLQVIRFMQEVLDSYFVARFKNTVIFLYCSV